MQKLQAARRDLALEAALAKLDRFDLIILDDISYAQKDQAETSVLFELIARRYETRSLAIAANQPFSAWDRVFPDQAVTVAAIDRLVHHATILEMNVDSYRRRAAADRSAAKADAADNLRRQPRRQPRQPPTASPTTSGRTSPPEPAAAAASTGQLGCRSRTSRLTLYNRRATFSANVHRPNAPDGSGHGDDRDGSHCSAVLGTGAGGVLLGAAALSPGSRSGLRCARAAQSSKPSR